MAGVPRSGILRCVKYVEPPTNPDEWSALFRENASIRRRGGALGRIARFFRDLFRYDGGLQRDFNIVALDLLRDLRTDLTALHNDIESLHADLVRSQDELTGELRDKFDRQMPIAVGRNDALVAALDQKIEMLAVRVRDVSAPILESHGNTQARNEFVYRRMEDALRGSETEIRAALEHYVSLAADHQPVLDIGCGRGEFLAMCRERRISATGFDTNERSVVDLRSRGFDVADAGIPDCFENMDAASIGSILASHVVEHIPADVLFSLFAESKRVLKPGGLLMIETPNAGSISMSATDFWRDPTHLGPRHAASLTVIAREFGFEIAEIRTTAPYPEANTLTVSESQPDDIRAVVARLNELLFGDQNLRVVLRKT